MVILDTDKYLLSGYHDNIVVQVTTVHVVIIGTFAGMLNQNHWFL